MRRFLTCALGLFLLLAALPAAAQLDQDGNLVKIVNFRAKPGMTQQLEAGIRKHIAWHQKQNDPWTWRAWQFVTGEEAGMYGAGTFDHSWADFDSPGVPEAPDMADMALTMGPYMDMVAVRFYARMPKVSLPAEGNPPLAEVIFFDVVPGRAPDFMWAVGKIHEGIVKTSWPVRYDWYALVNGGEQPHFVLVLPKQNWAAFRPIEKPFAAMLEEAYGRQDSEAILEKLTSSVASQRTSAIQMRPDLSYTPAAAKK